jgi:AcrR family transcriptional regulator
MAANTRDLARRNYAAGRATRAELIAIAERLFGERGFDAVSLREISAAAGTRNTAAAQYYFGNKQDLVRVVFEHRAEVLNARRTELLDLTDTWADGLRGTLDALIRPLAEQIGTSHYVSFLARLQADRIRDGEVVQLAADTGASFRRGRDELRGRLPELSDDVFRRRFRLLVTVSISALADFDRSIQTGHRKAFEIDDLITDLLDAFSGLLTAPSSRIEGVR